MRTSETSSREADNSCQRAGGLFRLQRWLQRLEDGLLVFLLMCMIAMAVVQIGLRTFFDFGIMWADGFVKLLVLWLGLLGAMVATRKDRHIRIDLISRYMPDRIGKALTVLAQLFTAVICGFVAYYGWKFVQVEFEYQVRAFAAVPAWICEMIIPFGFAVISLRYVVLSVNQFKEIIRTPS